MFLAQWASLQRALGGFTDAQHRQACMELLSAFLRGSCGCQLVIFLDDGFEARWPAASTGMRRNELNVTDEGLVDITSLAAKLQQCPDAFDASWGACLQVETPCSLVDLVVSGCKNARRGCSFFLQLIGECSRQLERVLEESRGGSSFGTDFSVEDIGWDTESPYQLELKLSGYMAASKRFVDACGIQHLSFGTDKSRAHGKAIQNTLFVAPTNECWWGVPQALLCVPEKALGEGTNTPARIWPRRPPARTLGVFLARGWYLCLANVSGGTSTPRSLPPCFLNEWLALFPRRVFCSHGPRRQGVASGHVPHFQRPQPPRAQICPSLPDLQRTLPFLI